MTSSRRQERFEASEVAAHASTLMSAWSGKSKSAMRSARSRCRRRLGLRAVTVDIDEWATINALIDRCVITEAEGLNPAAVSRALEKIIAAWVRRHA
jgi:hypothetical protein